MGACADAFSSSERGRVVWEEALRAAATLAREEASEEERGRRARRWTSERVDAARARVGEY